MTKHNPYRFMLPPDLTSVDQLNEYFNGYVTFTENHNRELRFYTNKSGLYRTIQSNSKMNSIFLNETFYNACTRYALLFDTPDQYLGSIYYELQSIAHKTRYNQYPPMLSFVEVFHDGVFVARHFIRMKITERVLDVIGEAPYKYSEREFTLCPHRSLEPDRSLCPFVRLPLISHKPTWNWTRFLWTRGRVRV